jgi:ATP-dependent RNA helicase RhlE
LTGEAFTFVAPDEEADLRAIERAVRTTLPRVTLPEFDYRASAPPLEKSHGQRIAEIRKRKAEERARATANGAGALLLRTDSFATAPSGRLLRRRPLRPTGFSGAGTIESVRTTREDTNVRVPCASNSITVWYSLRLLNVPCRSSGGRHGSPAFRMDIVP